MIDRARDYSPSRPSQPILFTGSTRLPPQNLEAERGILSAMLKETEAVEDALAVLKAEDFYRESHQILFRAIAELFSQGHPSDIVLVMDHLESLDLFERIGGMPGIEAIAGAVPHAANARYHAGIVREKAYHRRMIEVANTMLQNSYGLELTADDALSAAASALDAIETGDPADGPVPLSVALSEARASLIAREAGTLDGVPTGFATLDGQLGGAMVYSELLILAARPSIGKSALAANIAIRAALEAGVPVLYFSLEMRRQSLAERLQCATGHVGLERVRKPWLLTDEDHEALYEANRKIETAPLYLDQRRGLTVNQIAIAARRFHRRHGVRLVIVDYLQIVELEVSERGRNSNRQEAIASISRRLQKLAGEIDSPVLALSQLNRKSEGREDKRPHLSDLRESGQIEQDADVVMLMHRPDHYNVAERPGVVEIDFAKQRSGPTGRVELAFSGRIGRFDDPGTQDDGPEF